MYKCVSSMRTYMLYCRKDGPLGLRITPCAYQAASCNKHIQHEQHRMSLPLECEHILRKIN